MNQYTKKAIQDAIDFLDGSYEAHKIRKALQEVLAQPTQEPVAYTVTSKLGHHCGFRSTTVKKGDKLYTHPAPLWQGLSDDEKKKIWFNLEHEIGENIVFGGKLADAIEQALKDKNHV